MHLDIRLPSSWIPERKYAIDVLFHEFLGLEVRVHEDLVRDIEVSAGGRKLTLIDGLFACRPDEWLTPASDPVLPLPRWELPAQLIPPRRQPPSIPLLFSTTLANGGLITFEDDEIRLGADLVGGAFWLLTRYEELTNPVRDEHDRSQARDSLIFREGLLLQPLVNMYVDVLWQILLVLWPDLRRKRRAYAVRLTCDVDNPFGVYGRNVSQVARSVGADMFIRRDAGLALRRIGAYRPRHWGKPERDVNDTYDLMMDICEESGFDNTFFFQAGIARLVDYSIASDPMLRLLHRISDRGHEIGLHPTYNTYRDEAQLREELRQLRLACRRAGVPQDEFGGRQHYLRWENPTTWRLYESVGLTYDSTLSFADHYGFRTGSCFDYPVFDLEERRPLGIREQPLHVMDGTVVSYMGEDFERFVERTISLSETVRAHDGTLTILWHNHNLVSRQQRRLLKVLANGIAP